MIEELHIVDLDNILHTGKSKFSKNFNMNSFPTGGIYQFLLRLRSTGVLEYDNIKMICVSDTKDNFRKQIDPDTYKTHRARNKTQKQLIEDKGIGLQKALLIKYLREAGIPVLEMPGYEADDLMFNIVLHYAVKESQPLNNRDMSIVLHTSDADWTGAMGLADNIMLSSTTQTGRMSQIKDLNDFYRVEEYHPNEAYFRRMINGDKGDGYSGFKDWFELRVGGTHPYQQLMSHPKVEEIGFHSVFWNMGWWYNFAAEEYGNDQKLVEVMQKHIQLAFPYYIEELVTTDINGMLRKVDTKPLLNLTNTFRLKSLEKQVGHLEPYGDKHHETLQQIIRGFRPKYNDVFDMYKEVSYELNRPKEALSVEEMDKVVSEVTYFLDKEWKSKRGQ